MVERLAVYAASFDPPTVGHLWMIERGAELFDRLHVAVGTNPEKRCTFTLDERRALLAAVTRHPTNIEIGVMGRQFLARYAEQLGARFLLRGIRNETDYLYERQMRHINGDVSSSVTTVFVMPPREIAEVSSSLVKGLVGLEGWEDTVRRYVPPPVLEKLREVQHASSQR